MFSIETPINNLSFGQTAVNILYELFRRDLKPNLFPIGNNADLSAFDVSQEFKSWLEQRASSAMLQSRRDQPGLKLWHLVGGLTSYSDKRVLLTFHETDTITPTEANILHQNDKVLVTSRYTQQVMKEAGVENVIYCPLGFDERSFFQTHKKYFPDDVICFGLGGKLEKRKHHLKVLRAWVKRYGNNPRFRLNCALSNSHLDQNTQGAMIMQALEGKRYHNVNFLPYMQSNRQYNDFLNCNNIYLGMSGGEGFDLPVFQSAALGKHIVGLRAHVYQDYLNDKNAILIDPSGKEPVYDGIFFHPNQPFNQGSIFTWDDEVFIDGCERAVTRYLSTPVNADGKELRSEFTYERTAQIITDALFLP